MHSSSATKPSIYGGEAKARENTKNKKYPRVLDLLDYLADQRTDQLEVRLNIDKRLFLLERSQLWITIPL
jgi:hypothetical protein